MFHDAWTSSPESNKGNTDLKDQYTEEKVCVWRPQQKFSHIFKKSESSGDFRQPSSASHYWHLMHKDRKFWKQTERERREQQLQQFGGEGRIQTAGYIFSFLFLCSVISHSLRMYSARNGSAALTCSFFLFTRLNIPNKTLLQNSTFTVLTVGSGEARCNSRHQAVNIRSTAVHKEQQPGIAASQTQRDTAHTAGRSS